MKRKILLVAGLLFISGASVATYLWFMPHRDVVASEAEVSISVSDLVTEFLHDAPGSNIKYLSDDGDGKIIIVTGDVESSSVDLNNQTVILLKNKGDSAGVSCTFTAETNNQAANLKEGQKVSIKGVIRAGAAYDSDLGFYEDVILEKCSINK